MTAAEMITHFIMGHGMRSWHARCRTRESWLRSPLLTPPILLAGSLMLWGCNDSGNGNASSATAPSAPVDQSKSPAWLADVAAERGIAFTWISGHEKTYYLPETAGGGAAMFDFDNDGWLDVYLVQGGHLTRPQDNPPNVLLRNRGDGTFEEVPDAGGANDRGYGMGAACGDFDNDGWIDLYVTNVGRNVLYRNNGNQTFTDVTDKAGVGHSGWGTSAAFLDFDRDGDLDLYACNYLNWSVETEQDCYNWMGTLDYCSPNNYVAPAMDVLYRNNGDGTFTDVTLAAGLGAYFGNGLGVVCADFNDDGWVDVFVANDGMRNQLWINQQNGTFLDQALLMGCAVDEEGRTKAGMGVSASDIDDDGDFDVLVGNLIREGDTLFLRQADYFSDATARAGMRAPTRPFTTFGLGFIDFNNDGRLDVYQVHGAVMRSSRKWSESDPYAEPNLLFRGSADGRFSEVEPSGGTSMPLIHASRAAVFGDFDNDGGVDVLVINRDAPAYLLRNVVPQRGHWVRFRVMDGKRDAEGAIVTATLGERTITRTVHAAFSYLASNDPRVHLGLGQANRIENVRVKWVDGTIESFGSFDADRDYIIRRGTAK